MSRPPLFEDAIVDRARMGDTEAVEDVLKRLEPILRAFFLKRIGSSPDVDDLVQNTLVRIHTGLPDLRDASRLKAFAMKAAFFEVQDLYRGRYHAKESLLDPDYPDPASEEHNPAPDRIDAERALALLSPHAREIMELRAYGYKYAEIAEAVDSTESAIKMQVKRAFDKMRSTLTALLVWFAASQIGDALW